MIGFVEERKTLRIAVYPSAKAQIERFAAHFDMKEQGVASRLYEWFGRQPEPVQKWVIGLTDGNEGAGMREFARMLLEGESTSTSGPDVAGKIKADHQRKAAKESPVQEPQVVKPVKPEPTRGKRD